MTKINFKIFIKQLIAKDFLGKDSYRGVSLTYAWLANQLGHFTLGLFPSIVLSVIFKDTPPIVFSKWVAISWFSFEVLNLTMPLFASKKDRIFKPHWKNLIYDTITDILYFVLGAMFSALLVSEPTPFLIWTNIGLVALLLYPFIDWYTMRIYQQYAYFPFQFRLSQWKGEFLDEFEKIIVNKYVAKGRKKNTRGNHLLIYGSVHEGKCNLGVAIANELALCKQTCTYITATKLYSHFFETHQDPETLWNWQTSKFLVIDDINPDKLKLTKPSDFLNYVDTFTPMNEENRTILREKNIIWVLGVNELDQKEEWTSMLSTIGVELDNINIVNLSY